MTTKDNELAFLNYNNELYRRIGEETGCVRTAMYDTHIITVSHQIMKKYYTLLSKCDVITLAYHSEYKPWDKVDSSLGDDEIKITPVVKEEDDEKHNWLLIHDTCDLQATINQVCTIIEDKTKHEVKEYALSLIYGKNAKYLLYKHCSTITSELTTTQEVTLHE